MSIEVKAPYDLFLAADGAPLDGGKVYIGAENLNPETNPIAIYWDASFTSPAVNPVTTKGGVIYRNGTASKIYTKASYSITVKDKNGNLVYSNLSNNYVNQSSVATIADLSTIDTYKTGSNTVIVEDLDRGGTFIWSSTGTANGGTVFPGATGFWNRQYSGSVNVKWFGAKGDGVTDDSAAIQSAVNSLPSSGGELLFPSGIYLFSAITVSKHIKISCNGGFDGGVIWTNSSATSGFFIVSNTSAFIASGFKATCSAIKTAGSFFSFSNVNRIVIKEFFAEKFYMGIDIDGASEVFIEDFSMFDGVSGATYPNSGAIRLGNTIYTGSISIDRGYIKTQNASAQTSFGIRAKYVDVLNLGSSLTIIQCGTNLDISPSTGQTASLIKSFGATYDTASIGVNIAPTSTGKVVRCDFYGIWAGQHSVSGIVIDGTTSTIDGVLIHGGEFLNNTSTGINVQGANTKNVIIGNASIGGNGIGIRSASSADVRIENNTIGAVGFASLNTVGVAVDSSIYGLLTTNKFTTNSTNLSGTIGTNFSVFNNVGIDNWTQYTPTITSGTGTFTAVSATGRYKKSYQCVHYEITITITTNGTAASSILATLPVQSRVAHSGTGRAAGLSGKSIQSFAGGGSSSLLVANYDGTYAGASGETIIISGTYEIN